jgi:ABC-type transport system involved in multi-copper enzyme maturation permease subunit
VAGFRRFIINIVEWLLIVFIVLGTIFSAIVGAAAGAQMGGAMPVVMFLIYGFMGFLSTAVLAAFYFLLAEIAANTRRA